VIIRCIADARRRSDTCPHAELSAFQNRALCDEHELGPAARHFSIKCGMRQAGTMAS
jgi:hypothetical protein